MKNPPQISSVCTLYVALIICNVSQFYSGCSPVPSCCTVNTDNWNKACTSVADPDQGSEQFISGMPHLVHREPFLCVPLKQLCFPEMPQNINWLNRKKKNLTFVIANFFCRLLKAEQRASYLRYATSYIYCHLSFLHASFIALPVWFLS